MNATHRVAVGAALFALCSGGAAHDARSAAPVPTVTGPRTTTSFRPVYRFHAPGAIGFRCAFDSVRLHACAAKYAETLALGRHFLRVRAVARGGRLGPLVAVRIIVRLPPSALTAARPIRVGAGAGVPAVGAGAVWVPNTVDGSVSRIDPATGAVTATVPGPTPTPADARAPDCATNAACVYLDAALVAGGDVWVSDDYGGELIRIASSGHMVAHIAVSPRPGGLATGGGLIWVFHTRGDTVTRVDPASGSTTAFVVPGVHGAGIAYARGSVWLLSIDPVVLLRLDPRTLAVTARIPLEPFGARHPFIPAWSLAADETAVWAANPNYDMVTKVDAASARVVRHVRLPRDQPFGVALGGGALWVAARTGTVRIDPTRGAVTGELILPSVGSGYTSVAYGFGAAWVTNYERGVVTRVAPRRR